ncbi:MAG: sodium:solute symporter family protein [Planctomycetales bacterium]|nr:sodium:solute symporter family protein [Planctomycetales bacterium]
MQLIDYIVLLAYFAGMIAIGIWSMRRVHGQEDYFMGGRGFGKVMQTFAAFGAGTGAHEPVTVGRTAWTSGLSGVWSALMWLFVTPVYWIIAVWYRRMRHMTLGDWFVERYESRALGAAYSVFAIVFYAYYLSTMFSAIAAFAVPLMGIDSIAGYDLKYIVVPCLALIVVLYGVLGGLTAAYYTDLIQGLFIILLSVLLIPFGLLALVRRFGDSNTMGISDGFSILHTRVSADYFSLFGGPAAGEFPIQYIIALSVLLMVGIVVQPHFICTGGGSAKTEYEARVGLVVGNFLKRLCTVGWALTALIALALLAGNVEIAIDPDRVWGVAAREILGPLNIGLVGLMLACLMAAMMSSADAYMIVTSALVTRNIYAAYVDSQASEKTYVRVGRIAGLLIIVGAAIVAIAQQNVFAQFKAAVELPILFAAPFWLGMFWRRTTRTAVWGTMVVSLLLFFVLPMVLPYAFPALRNHPMLSSSSHRITKTTERTATEADVAKHAAWTAVYTQTQAIEDDKKRDDLLKKLGAEPPNASVGETIQVVTRTGGQSLFWDSLAPATPGQNVQYEKVSESQSGQTHILTERAIGDFQGQGGLKLDFVAYAVMGVDLSAVSKSTIETLRLPPRVLLPFLVLVVFSLITRRGTPAVLDRYYIKMRTEVEADHAADEAKLQSAYANPLSGAERRLFPGTDWEFLRPRAQDIIGFLVSIAVCGLIIGLLVFLAGIGS